jgi:hypothetical protein
MTPLTPRPLPDLGGSLRPAARRASGTGRADLGRVQTRGTAPCQGAWVELEHAMASSTHNCSFQRAPLAPRSIRACGPGAFRGSGGASLPACVEPSAARVSRRAWIGFAWPAPPRGGRGGREPAVVQARSPPLTRQTPGPAPFQRRATGSPRLHRHPPRGSAYRLPPVLSPCQSGTNRTPATKGSRGVRLLHKGSMVGTHASSVPLNHRLKINA